VRTQKGQCLGLQHIHAHVMPVAATYTYTPQFLLLRWAAIPRSVVCEPWQAGRPARRTLVEPAKSMCERVPNVRVCTEREEKCT
jgi:hypothetical protein